MTQSPLLSSLPKVRHGFLSDQTPGGRGSLDELLPEIATVKQVHGDLLLWTSRIEKREREADGLATFSPGLSVGVYSADCTPILAVAAGESGPLAVMAVHAGWRGTAKQIGKKSFIAFSEAALAKGATEFFAAVGPCISFESFEVGEEVVAAFPESLDRGEAKFLRMESGKRKYLFNLPGENSRQLKEAASEAGVKLQLEALDECTLKKKDLYPSYRRDREKAGRILSYLCFDR
jgi:YfiH family protein